MNNNRKSFISRLICVPKCASCRERLSPFAKNDELDHGFPCLCDACMEKWQRARAQMCHTCSNIASKCSCMPLKKVFSQPSIPSLFFYHPDQSRAESKVIYTLKHHNSLDLFRFISAELSPKLSELLDLLAIDKGECVLTYIPRTKRALIKNGFDQGEVLCRVMSRDLNMASAPLIVREGGSEQKKLSRKDRKINAEKAIFANTELKGVKCSGNINEFLENKTVIIIEDLITTGATVERAIKCLRTHGAKTVLVCAVARSEISSDKKHSSK